MFLAFIILIVTVTLGYVNSGKERIAEQTVKSKKRYEYISYEYSFKGGSGTLINQSGVFCDDMLFTNEKIYNKDLALSSFALAVSAFSAGDMSLHWGDNGSWQREKALSELYDDLHFTNPKFYGYDVSLNDSSSKAAFGIASKKAIHDNAQYDIVAIAVRGGAYGAEWADNFLLGSDEYSWHRGFEQSADTIKKYADEYIAENCKSGAVRLWIAGYSRGAAVANILSAKFNAQANKDIALYCYTFATPNTAIISETNIHDIQNDNIFNIINPYDAITTIPPNSWGFGKAGQSIVFPPKTDFNTDDYEKVAAEYENLTGKKYNMVSGNNLQTLADIIVSASGTRSSFSKLYEPVFKDLMLFLMTRVPDDNGKWIKPKFIDFLTNKYGIRAKQALSQIKNSENMIALSEIGIKLPTELEYFIILSHLHGISDPESIVITNFDFETISKLFKAFGSGGSLFDAKPHYPEVYLSWLKAYDLSQIQPSKI